MAGRKFYHTTLSETGPVSGSLNTGAAPVGTTGATNKLRMGNATWEQFILGAGQTIVVPTIVTGAAGTDFGIDISLDQTVAEGAVYTPFSNHQRSPLAFTIGTDAAFFVRAKFKIADVSGINPFSVGFHGSAAATNPLQAHQATYADYTDKACLTLTGTANPNIIQIVTALNNAADVTTDTTNTLADATTCQFKVLVSSAGVVTYQHDAVTPGTLAAPTVTAAFTFDTGDVVTPFIYFLHAADVAGTVELLEFECGLQ